MSGIAARSQINGKAIVIDDLNTDPHATISDLKQQVKSLEEALAAEKSNKGIVIIVTTSKNILSF